MATNIYNPETNTYGYQVPGAALPGGYVSTQAAPINSSSLATVSPYQLPPQTPNTTSAGVIAATNSNVIHPADQATKTVNDLFGGVDKIQSQKNDALGSVQSLLGQEADLQTAQQNSPEEQQLSTERTNLANINTEIANQQVAYRAEQDKIKGRGDISQNAQAGLNQNLDDVYGSRLANLAIRQSAATGNITALTAASDRALKMKLAPLDTQISYYRDYLSKNLDNLSDTAKQRVTAIIAEKKNEQDQITADQNTANEALKSALTSGIKVPDDVVQEIQKNPGQAYQILADNGISLQNPLDVQIKQATLAKTYADIAKMKDDAQVLSIKDAETLGVPYGTTKAQAIAAGKTPGVSEAASGLKTTALDSAKALLDKFNSGNGTSAVGFSRIFGSQYVPGTAPKNFQVQLDNLKSLLSLDNVKLLKGQGQISDSERLLLERASGKLDPSQSEGDFKQALTDVITGLSGTGNSSGYSPGTVVEYQGKQYRVGEDGETLEAI